MSRWEISDLRVSEQYSITPDLKNQSLAAYLNQLDRQGVNTAVINVQPSVTANQTCNLPTQQSISTQDWNNYTVALFLPDAAKNSTQLQAFDSGRGTIENRNCTNGYTLAQRDSVILTFLQRVQTLYNAGSITGNVKFFLDQRRWFQTGIDPQTRTTLEGEYAGDLADIVTQAQGRGLDSWLLGIRLQEHNNGNQDAAAGGGGWSGRVFMDAYSDRDFEPNDPTDVGHSLAFVDYSSLNHTGSSQVHYEPASVSFWQQWQQ